MGLHGGGLVVAAFCAAACIFVMAAPVAVDGCSCSRPFADCDFFFRTHTRNVPTITLIQKGDHEYTSTNRIMHRIGGRDLPVANANSYACQVKKNRRHPNRWSNVGRCQLRLYADGGPYLHSREFNVGALSDFNNNCIKVKIGSAQYVGGGNFNNGQNQRRACIVVNTRF